VRRLNLLSVALVFWAVPFAGDAQEAVKVWRVGLMSPYSAEHASGWRAGLLQGLRELDYVEGRNLLIEERHAGGQLERVPELASELVRLKVDVIVSHGNTAAILAAMKGSSTIPIVMVANPDPVGLGLVSSLARPGGNVTGLSDLHSELGAKRLELLKAMVPSVSRVGVLWNSKVAAHNRQLKDTQAAAPGLRLAVVPLEIRGPDDIDGVFTMIRRERLDALNVLGGAVTIHGRRVADLAIKNRLPTITTTRRSAADDGFLMSYGADFPDLYRRAATYVDKILKGVRPADLAIEQPARFELVINMKTVKRLGITVPHSLRLRADHVVE
jgi:putative ABC transport system substrate-binding protein